MYQMCAVKMYQMCAVKMYQMCAVKIQALAGIVKEIYFKVNKKIFVCFEVTHPVHVPVPRPMVKYSVRTFCAKTLSTKHAPARNAPAMVTARQPYLFTNELEIGPVKQQ